MRDAFRRDHHPDDRLSAFLDDELDDDESLEVARHVGDCSRCLAELDDIRAARAALRRLPNVDPPAALFDDVMVAASGAASRWPVGARLLAAGIAGSALLGGAAFAVGGDDPSATVVPPVELFVVDHVVRVGGGPVMVPVDLDVAGR